MNSQQRRKLKRGNPYSIRIKYAAGQRHFEWDNQVLLMRAWCNKFARKGWISDNGWNSIEFCFKQEHDHLMFALRWS